MVCNYAMWYAIIIWSQLRKRSIHCLKLRMQMFNPFRIAKAASNGNHRLCLKSKPQVKCHWSLPAGSTSVSEARTPRPALNFGHRTGPPPHPGRAIRKGPNKAIHKINRKWSTSTIRAASRPAPTIPTKEKFRTNSMQEFVRIESWPPPLDPRDMLSHATPDMPHIKPRWLTKKKTK